MKEKLQSIREMAAEAMSACADSRELDAIRVKYAARVLQIVIPHLFQGLCRLEKGFFRSQIVAKGKQIQANLHAFS